jgi:hypothetical protein
MPTTPVRRFTSLFSRSSRFTECNLLRCGARKVHAGENVVFAVVHDGGEPWEAWPELAGYLPPGRPCSALIRL